jgi:hypothetical protein
VAARLEEHLGNRLALLRHRKMVRLQGGTEHSHHHGGTTQRRSGLDGSHPIVDLILTMVRTR